MPEIYFLIGQLCGLDALRLSAQRSGSTCASARRAGGASHVLHSLNRLIFITQLPIIDKMPQRHTRNVPKRTFLCIHLSESRNSKPAILPVPFSQSFSSESRYAFSATLGEGVGLVCVLFLVCFFSCLCLGRFNTGISQEAKEVRTSHDTLADVLEQVEGFSDVSKSILMSPTPEMTHIIIQIMVEVVPLDILSIRYLTALSSIKCPAYPG